MTTPVVKDKDYRKALVESLAEAHAEIERLKAWLLLIAEQAESADEAEIMARNALAGSRAALEQKP